MSTTTASCAAASTPATGTPNPFHLLALHAEAQKALDMAVFYLRQPTADVPGARLMAVKALTALRGLSLALEG
ncbi:hypothetical protein DJFAAGMI_04420 [Comamonas sp. PE63]|uniref:Uncharacterized protein n=1 Tax=Comamonas brasiliensis TaxID=1812482 RepID=A0ABS5LYQ8_9BURK|nr:hypothetical protein [Comamonas sp. PE63]MBS3021646.1 hypothetical protein [Comamonas sp. PE63]